MALLLMQRAVPRAKLSERNAYTPSPSPSPVKTGTKTGKRLVSGSPCKRLSPGEERLPAELPQKAVKTEAKGTASTTPRKKQNAPSVSRNTKQARKRRVCPVVLLSNLKPPSDLLVFLGGGVGTILLQSDEMEQDPLHAGEKNQRLRRQRNAAKA